MLKPLHTKSGAFHWELEFPEIFFEAHRLKPIEQRGFDAVVGNPPYFNVNVFGKGSSEQCWLRTTYPDIWQDKSDILFYFLHRGAWLTREHLAMILSNAFVASDKAGILRHFLANNASVRAFINFRDFPVFEAGIATCIPLPFYKNGPCSQAPCLEVVDPALPVNIIIRGLQEFGDGSISVVTPGAAAVTINIPADGKRWVVSDDSARLICDKVDTASLPLGRLFSIGEGMQTGCNDAFILAQKPPAKDAKFWRVRTMGDDIGRYNLGEPRVWLIWAEDLESPEKGPVWLATQLRSQETALRARAAFQRGNCEWFKFTWPLHKELYNRRKLWCSYRARENTFAYDDTRQFIGLTNTTVIFDTNDEYDLLYVLALLNSTLLTWRYRYIGKKTGSGMMEFFENQIRDLPVRRISFATSAAQRTRFFEKGKKLYESCLTRREPDFILAFIAHELIQNPERAEVVHDLLAYLAERMIHLGNEKQTEIRGFHASFATYRNGDCQPQ